MSASNLPAGPLLLALLLLGACDYETTRSGTLTERGRVAMTVYTPATHGSGTGFSSGGHVVFTEVDIEPVYAIVFECAHGQFVITRDQDFWKRYHQGDSVVIRYEEIYHVNKKTNARTLWDYDFLDATPYRTPREVP